MDLPQNGIMVMDDFEAQRRSQWLTKLNSTLVANETRLMRGENKVSFCILKVPKYYREPSGDFTRDYTPSGWRFGLHNCDNLETTGSEVLKIMFARLFGLVGEEFGRYCEFVVDDPKSMLQCYGLQEEESSWTDEVIQKQLALDALFLALHLDRRIPTGCWLWSNEKRTLFKSDHVNYSKYRSFENILLADICKYENQIPFRLIERAWKYLRRSTMTNRECVPDQANEASLYYKWAKEAAAEAVKAGIRRFMDVQVDIDQIEITDLKHILGLTYEVICGQNEMQQECDHRQQDYVHIPSATQLKASGIHMKRLPVEEGTLDNMSFEKNCLSLPKMNMYGETIPFIRNMATYEEHLGKCLFHDYILIMVDLIRIPSDLELLIECGIVANENASRAFDDFVGVEKYQALMPSSSTHNKMKAAINKRCKVKRLKLWDEFRRRFCSRPWLALSTITIVLVTVATLVQTYVAIIASNQMDSQFIMYD